MGLASETDLRGFTAGAPAIRTTSLMERDALVVAKFQSGFDRGSVDAIFAILRAAAGRAYGPLRFLVFDFQAGGANPRRAPEGFADLVAANAELIVGTPLITLAWARGLMDGLDFDFAMHCSAIVAETDARFSFAGDPFDLLGLYAALGRRIGFTRAERLIESNPMLSAQEARDMLLVKDVTTPAAGVEGISAYLARFERRYNATHAIFRAQRLAERPIDRRPIDAPPRRA